MAGHVYLIDDDACFRRSLVDIISSIGLVHHEWESPEQFLALNDLKRPGCVVVDYRLPMLSGLDVLKSIRSRSSIPMVLISAYADVRLAVDAMQAGAASVFEKPLRDNEFLGFIGRLCFEDGAHLTQRGACSAIQAQLERLSESERQVLELMVGGFPSKVIANTLGKSTKTVERNRKTLAAKLDCRSSHEVLLKVTRCPMMASSPLNCATTSCPLLNWAVMSVSPTYRAHSNPPSDDGLQTTGMDR